MCASNNKPRPACWHSQQSVEKALKAALISENVNFPHIHDLDELRDMLPASWSVKNAHPSLAKITKYAIESRYPEKSNKFTTHDAHDAISTARKVHDSINAELRNRGVT